MIVPNQQYVALPLNVGAALVSTNGKALVFLFLNSQSHLFHTNNVPTISLISQLEECFHSTSVLATKSSSTGSTFFVFYLPSTAIICVHLFFYCPFLVLSNFCNKQRYRQTPPTTWALRKGAIYIQTMFTGILRQFFINELFFSRKRIS